MLLRNDHTTTALRGNAWSLNVALASLKRRFLILQGRVGVHLNLIPSVIVVCCIMHNVAKYLKDPDDFPDYVILLGNIGNPDLTPPL